MKKFIFTLIFLAIHLNAWVLIGTKGDINVSKLDLSNNTLWAYQDGEWKTTADSNIYGKLETIQGGEGFWATSDITLPDVTANNSYTLKNGWNLVSPVDASWDLNTKFGEKVPFAWKYSNNTWSLYRYNATNNGFTDVSLNEGVWIYYVLDNSIQMDNIPLACNNGTCDTITTSNTNYLISLKTDQFNTDLKFGIDLYRYSNTTHYKFAFGPFQIDSNGNISNNITVCAEKDGIMSCKEATNSFLNYSNGYLTIDSQAVAALFDRTIPTTDETLDVKIYIEGFSINGFVDGSDFGTIETGDSYVQITNDKTVSFKMEVK